MRHGSDHTHGTRGFARGFSLIELLLVLVILSVLAALVVPKFTGRSEQAKVTGAQTDIGRLEIALDAFEIDNGRFPTSDEGIRALLEQPGDTETWRGPYVKRGLPLDPWGNEYIYEYPGRYNENGYDLYSLGPDEQDGTEDDIKNWSEENR
jgi:general secretion pathway protein G